MPELTSKERAKVQAVVEIAVRKRLNDSLQDRIRHAATAYLLSKRDQSERRKAEDQAAKLYRAGQKFLDLAYNLDREPRSLFKMDTETWQKTLASVELLCRSSLVKTDGDLVKGTKTPDVPRANLIDALIDCWRAAGRRPGSKHVSFMSEFVKPIFCILAINYTPSSLEIQTRRRLKNHPNK